MESCGKMSLEKFRKNSHFPVAPNYNLIFSYIYRKSNDRNPKLEYSFRGYF